MVFLDRVDAGKKLGELLAFRRHHHDIVLGLARGGVPVAAEVAKTLDCPLDVLVVRKLGAPQQPELALGAIAEGGERVLNRRLMNSVSCSESDLELVTREQQHILNERIAAYRKDRARLDLTGKDVIIVDDGLATGMTARVACQLAKKRGATNITVAVPVASIDAMNSLVEADDVVALYTPSFFYAVGMHYQDFDQTTDQQVRELLEEADARLQVTQTEVVIPAYGTQVHGSLRIPHEARMIVIFAHGSGSGRFSPRNRFVARALNEAGLATLLIDLLSEEEESQRTSTFDIKLLSRRLSAAAHSVAKHPKTAHLVVGLFGASTGAAAALSSAADGDLTISAVVSRGGRPDLADDLLSQVDAPTLLIVGGLDHNVLVLNRKAQAQLRGVSELEVIPGATHLFEEPGTLRKVADLATRWFLTYSAPDSATLGARSHHV